MMSANEDSSNAETAPASGQAKTQPDDADQVDVDSAVGDDRSALTQSLRSSLRESIQEKGRGMQG